MKIGKIAPYFSQRSNTHNSVNQQNLTNCGVEGQNKTQLLSKEAATALRNNFVANVSFSGYVKNVNIKYEGEQKDFFVETNSYCLEYTYAPEEGYELGNGGKIYSKPTGVEHRLSRKQYWQRSSCTANIDGKNEGSYSALGQTPYDAMINVIAKSDNLIKGSRIFGYISDYVTAPKGGIKEIASDEDGGLELVVMNKYENMETREECDPTSLYLDECEDREIKVYFCDQDECFDENKLDEVDFIVYPPRTE